MTMTAKSNSKMQRSAKKAKPDDHRFTDFATESKQGASIEKLIQSYVNRKSAAVPL